MTTDLYIATPIFGSSRRDEKDNKKATRGYLDGQWEDFFEAALIDRLEDEGEQDDEQENGSVASSQDSDDNDV
jgi:hypothetical protein